MTFRQEYQDSRLAWTSNNAEEHVTLTGEEAESVWMPDTFVRNERSVIFHDALVPNKYARIFPDGTVLTSQRVTLQLSCPGLQTAFKSRSGPHECDMEIASCKYSVTQPIKINLLIAFFQMDGKLKI